MFNPKHKSKSQKYYVYICQPNMLAKKKKIAQPNPSKKKKLCDHLFVGGLMSQLGSPRVQPG